MKKAALAVWFAGIAAVVGLVVWSGAGSVGEAVARAGWGVLLVILLRAAQMGSAGAAWWLVLPPAVRPPLGVVELLRMVREGGNALLPTAQVGGDVIGARLLTFWRVDGATAAGSVIVDVTMLAGTQFAFTLIGVLLLAYLSGSGPIVRDTAAGLVLAAFGLTALFLIQGSRGRGVPGAGRARHPGGRGDRALRAVRRADGRGPGAVPDQADRRRGDRPARPRVLAGARRPPSSRAARAPPEAAAVPPGRRALAALRERLRPAGP
jgi:hypothetical protein